MMNNIENNVAIPEEVKPKSRARRQAAPKKEKVKKASDSLLNALKFISPAQKKSGPTNEQFCYIANGWIAASNGILTIGSKIEEDLNACPHTVQFMAALSKVDEDLSITQLSENSLAVASGVFRALVPCVGIAEVPITPPDASCAVVDDRVKESLAAVMGLAVEASPVAHFAAILLQRNSAVATNGTAMLESWHGIDLPQMLMPKASAAAIAKCGKTLTGFGYSGPSATFWFEDGSFIKTQLFAERFPIYEQAITIANYEPKPIPDNFFDAVRTISQFTEDNRIYLNGNGVASSRYEENASTYKINGLTEEVAYDSRLLLQIESGMKFFDIEVNHRSSKMVFHGDNIRAAVMGFERPAANVGSDELNDDDIPF